MMRLPRPGRGLYFWILAIVVLILFWIGQYRQEVVVEDPLFQVPFCDANGTCHEKPNQPSPRTRYSAKSKDQYDQWWSAHAILNRTAATFASQLAESRRLGKRPLILYGDSITESWIGTDMQRPKPRTKGMAPTVLQETFLLPRYGLDVLVAAIGGDQTQHLLYRLEHGELLPEFADDEQSVFVVLIGTNNLGSGELPGPTAEGIVAVTRHLLNHTLGSILLMKLLPRGDNFRLANLCPPRCSPDDGKPFQSFMPAIEKVNRALDDFYAQLVVDSQAQQQRVKLADCGQHYLNADGQVNEELMPDWLHPNVQGQRLLGECIIRELEDGFDLFA